MTNMIKIAICDDEKRDRERLQKLVYEFAQKYEQTYEIEIFESGEEYMDRGFVADILFLDIMMNNKDGIQIGEEVRKQKGNTIIIYTTNLTEKMAIAFNRIHSFGYLMKPIKNAELFQMMSDAIEQVEKNGQSNKVIVTFLSENNTIIQLPVEDIFYFEYYERKVKIVTKDRHYICKEKITDIAEKMREYEFMMSHQSFVVNLYCVDRFAEQALIMKNGDMVYLAQKRTAAIRKRLMQLANELGQDGGRRV